MPSAGRSNRPGISSGPEAKSLSRNGDKRCQRRSPFSPTRVAVASSMSSQNKVTNGDTQTSAMTIAPMAYIEESLSAGEQIVGFFRLHWICRRWMVLWIVLAIPPVGITLILALFEFLRLRSIEQGVTNKRVIYKKGIISRKSEEMKLNSIETVEIDQGIAGRIFGFGDVTVTGRGLSNVAFKSVDDPMAVKRKIESVSNPVG